MPKKDLNRLKEPTDYRTADGRERIFKTDPSLKWFIRKHRAALEKAGAVVSINNRPMIDPPIFDAVAVDLALSEGKAA
jgi:hypothetical protein